MKHVNWAQILYVFLFLAKGDNSYFSGLDASNNTKKLVKLIWNLDQQQYLTNLETAEMCCLETEQFLASPGGWWFGEWTLEKFIGFVSGWFLPESQCQSQGRCCMLIFVHLVSNIWQYLAYLQLGRCWIITSLRDPKLSFRILWGHASFEQCLKPFAAHILNGWFGRDLILERILL